MLGLYGAFDLSGGERRERLNCVAEDLCTRLGGRAETPMRVFDRAVVGRSGAEHQHNQPWPGDDGAPAVAGVLRGELPAGPLDPSRIEGFYAIVAEEPDGGLLLVADRRASVPIYFACHDEMILFAPSVAAIISAAPDLPREIDLAALGSFLASGHLVADQTLFRSVRRLRGGQMLRARPGGTQIETYWRFRPGSRANGTRESDLGEELLDRVEAAVAGHLGEREHSFIFLSGGADSRGLLAAALKAGPAEQINAVTWSSDSGGLRSDLEIARRVAAAAKIRHRIVQYGAFGYAERFREANAVTDALTDTAAFHPYFLAVTREIAGAGLTTGLRGDEAFGWWHTVRSMEDAKLVVGLRSIEQAGTAQALRPELRPAVAQAQAEALDNLAAEVAGLTPDQAKDIFYFDHRLQCYLGVENRLRQTLLDLRNPFLHESILDLMDRVPDRLRAHKLLYQRSMARRYPELWEIGIAGELSTEDWRRTFAQRPDVRSFVTAELADGGSNVWDLLDRDFLAGAFDRLGAVATQSPAPWKSFARSAVRAARPYVPAALAGLAGRPSGKPRTVLHRLIMRAMALKHWHDAYRPPPPTAGA